MWQLILLLFSFFYVNAEDLQLKLVGPPVEGQPFQIQTILSASGSRDGEVEVLGLENFDVLGTSDSQRFTYINGRQDTEVERTYTIRPRAKGDLELGPASVLVDGKKLVSNKLKFKVGGLHTSKSTESVFLRLISDKSSVVLGESIMLNVKLYHSNNITDASLSLPKSPGFITKELDGTTQGTEEVNGRTFIVLTKKFLLTPIKVGVSKIDPIQASFSLPARRRVGLFDDMFSDFFSQGYQQKVVASNVLDIKVENIQADGISAVGKFQEYCLDISSKEAKINEPITLKAILKGEGNFEQVQSPKFELPEGFECYDSKKTTNYLGLNSGEKVFEYVLQVDKPGELEIPAQKFGYYDTNSRNVKYLISKPIKLAIMGSAKEVLRKPVTLAKNETTNYEEDINYIEEDGPLFSGAKKHVNLWVFILLLILPAILFAGRSLGFIYKVLINRFSGFIKPHDAKVMALNNLKDLRAVEGFEGLYQLMLSFLSDKFRVVESTVGEDWIRSILLKREWPFEKVENFLDYFHKIAGLSFASYEKKSIDSEKLFADTENWIKMIDKKDFRGK